MVMKALKTGCSTNLVISVLTFASFPACPFQGSLPFHKFPILCLFFRELHLERYQWFLYEPKRLNCHKKQRNIDS